ncbi:cyclin-domain-containing protein [Suhomyces tanzawaensis NRRL Y-17324]|uniref:Cyclin-domain-containing protein n=1 Tax=Suhomyces tanzawaensis NRRL Y-17324 TaxID=984487 RepID=A0A1E4SDP2_9ASCO|nr:cyclin-domain-containing protein [Suhomyces tanzawaensis NRRL Y-17324]ODV77639.1 cyclin-domain-containing protein [Suhomyces tanzawaensis NRRL Y-17324]
MSSQYNDSSTTLEQAYNRSHSPSAKTDLLDGAEAKPASKVDSSGPVPFHNPPNQMSNLTKTLLSSSQTSSMSSNLVHQVHPSLLDQGAPANPPSYGSMSSSFNNSRSNQPPQMSIPYQQNSYQSGSFHQYNTPINDSINYIPSSHNTPTMVSSSYSSNHSVTPSVHTSSFVPPANNFQHLHPNSSSYKAPGIVPHAIPTTNISMDSASSRDHSLSFQPSSSFGDHASPGVYIPQLQPPSHLNLHRYPNSLPVNGGNGSSIQNQNSFFNNRGVHGLFSKSTNSNLTPVGSHQNQTSTSTFQPGSQTQLPQNLSSMEPDHYMSYKEFLHNLSTKDGAGSPSNISSTGNNINDAQGSMHEEHLNIVDYPVNDLIVMLSCLLTKIIEANDKLHPNHFDNTIAIRQRMKEEKRVKKLERTKLREEKRAMRVKSQKDEDGDDKIDVDIDESQTYHNNTIEIDEVPDESEDDEELDKEDEDDEMKNKYLANVLAFHGTNVPGISLHAYLARVLKYCPVTNEVFLSLLVYFDRIAKKANNLKLKKKESEKNGEESSNESEQLFVMDSYNIHRLIISGITVSSKFFSDIFYKNLRYAKVGGLPLEELNYLELQFLLLLDFKLMISVEDLQNYGDLLLRFWKREQLTNELVHPDAPKTS